MKLPKFRPSKRRGFTLPEILVSITLVAVLAAVVVPSIASQVKKGDPARIGQDYVSVRGAVEQFLTDVRRYPGTISQLQAGINSGSLTLSGTAVTNFGTADINRWRGPYLNRELSLTGYGLTVNSSFDNEQWAANANTACLTASCGVRYMVLTVPITQGNDSTLAVELDKQFDDGDTKNGSIRYRRCSTSGCSTSPDTLKLLLLPIQP